MFSVSQNPCDGRKACALLAAAGGIQQLLSSPTQLLASLANLLLVPAWLRELNSAYEAAETQGEREQVMAWWIWYMMMLE